MIADPYDGSASSNSSKIFVDVLRLPTLSDNKYSFLTKELLSRNGLTTNRAPRNFPH